MLRAHAVVDAVEPGLQIGEDEVDHRHELFGHFGVAAFGNCMVVEAPLALAAVLSAASRPYRVTRSSAALAASVLSEISVVGTPVKAAS